MTLIAFQLKKKTRQVIQHFWFVFDKLYFFEKPYWQNQIIFKQSIEFDL